MVDLIDRKLLYELNKDCRQSHTALGKRLRVSKQVIAYRIRRLEEEGILRGYHALIDWRKLGYNAIRMYLKWRNINPATEREIYDMMRDDPFFMWTVKFDGEMDIGFYTWVDSIPEFARRWHAIRARFKRHLLKEEIYESVRMVHYPMKPLIEDYDVEEKILGDGGRVEHDEKDYAILTLLTQNARMPIVEIGQKVELSPKAVMHRMKQLERREIVLGHNALIDMNKLGYSYYKVDFYLADLSRLNEMNEYAKQHRNIVYRMNTIGGPDFEIEVMITDAHALNALIEEIRERFHDCISHLRTHWLPYTIKQVYLPGEEAQGAEGVRRSSEKKYH